VTESPVTLRNARKGEVEQAGEKPSAAVALKGRGIAAGSNGPGKRNAHQPDPERVGYVALHRAARPLFDCWPQVVQSIRSANSLALFLDFDGTLAALRKLPGDVRPLDLTLRKVLDTLARHPRLRVYVISGRRLADIRRLVPVRGLRLLGLHGWEGRRVPLLRAERGLLREAREVLARRLLGLSEIRLEDKGLAVAVHYRSASPRVVRLARVIVEEVLRDLRPRIHMLRGHKVWELLPRQIAGKGASVLALLSRLPQPTLAIFVGDDATDESAFRALAGGLTIRVGKHPRTSARFLLESPKEVKLFLVRLEAAIPADGSSGVERLSR